MKESFLCRYCKRAMCKDCKSIAEEYQELLERRTRALSAAESEREAAVREAEQARKRADDYEHIMKLGQHPMMLAWMDSLSSDELRQAVERADRA